MPVDKNPSPSPSQTNGLNSNPSQNSPKKSNHHQNQVSSQTTLCPNPQNQNQRPMFQPPFCSLHLLKLQPFASLTSCLQHPSFPLQLLVGNPSSDATLPMAFPTNLLQCGLRASTLIAKQRLIDLRLGESVHACVIRLVMDFDLYTGNALMNMKFKFESLCESGA